MQNLVKFIDSQNSWNAIFGKPAMDFMNLSQADVDELARDIDAKLSPENLMQDGEAPIQQVIKTRKYLDSVAAELEEYAQLQMLDIPCFYN